MRGFLTLVCAVLLAACGGASTDVSQDGSDSPEVAVADAGGTDVVRLPETGAEAVGVEALAEETFAEVSPELMGPGPGEAGAACEGDGDCFSGYCIYTADGYRCTATCEEECPFDWTCAAYVAGGPDEG